MNRSEKKNAIAIETVYKAMRAMQPRAAALILKSESPDVCGASCSRVILKKKKKKNRRLRDCLNNRRRVFTIHANVRIVFVSLF